MTGRVFQLALVLGVFVVLAGAINGAAPKSDDWLGPCAVVCDPGGQKLYVAQAKANRVAVYDTDSGAMKPLMDLPASPTGLAISGDGKMLYATCAAPQGVVCAIDISDGETADMRMFPAGLGACSPVLSPDGKTLYVCNRFDDEVGVYEAGSGKGIRKIAVLREPIAAAVTGNGRWLFVCNHLPDGPATADVVAASVSVIDTKSQKVERSIPLPNGSTSVQGIAASPDGQYVFVAHVLGRYTVPTTQLERGWMNTNALSIIDTKERKLFETVLLDDVDRGAANPWAVACTKDGEHVCVTHAGTDELSVVDIDAMIEKIREHRGSETGSGSGGYGDRYTSEIPNRLSFLYGIRQRVKLSGKGARSVALIGSMAYVPAYFTDTMSVVDMAEAEPRAKQVVMGKRSEMSVERRGEMLFHDATLCFQNWQSCSSCHPGNARVDALNWDLLNDGLGNPKNTKSLLLSHQTPPAMMRGVRADAETAVRAGITHIQFAVRPEEEPAAIDVYLKALQPMPSPHLVNGQLSASAKRGKELFETAGCASCHSGPLHTNMQMYDVGTGEGLDAGKEFDTPTLVEIWRTAPYLYDGRAATIEDVLTKFNPKDEHGKTTDLSVQEIKDLAEFVLSQ